MAGLLNHKLFRKGSRTSLQVAGAMPNSGMISLDNSQGAARTAAELSQVLDESLQNFDFKGDFRDLLKAEMERLQKEAQKYINGRVEELHYGRQWSCSREEAQVIYLAAQCAASAYDSQTAPFAEEGLSVERLEYIKPSMGGKIKGTSFSVCEVLQYPTNNTPASAYLPALVIAVRGTDSVVDGMVNANGDSQESRGFFGMSNPQKSVPGTEKPAADIKVHSGFLNGAGALSQMVEPLIKKYLLQAKVNHLIFTGHSAGGATTALLFAHFLSQEASKYPNLKVSSITFGAPPVTNPDLTSFIKEHHPCAAQCGLVLAIANEKDLVSRVDNDYVRSVLDLYRMSRGYPPLSDLNESHYAAQQQARSGNQLAQDQLEEIPATAARTLVGQGGEGVNEPHWQLPEPNYYNMGELIVFRNANSEEDVFELSAVAVSPGEFCKLVFCDVEVHSRKYYLANVGDLLHKERVDGG